MAMAIFLPITLHMDFVMSMLFLTAIFTGGSFGGGVTAILMNIPGTSSALATAFDGYPMARQGNTTKHWAWLSALQPLVAVWAISFSSV